MNSPVARLSTVVVLAALLWMGTFFVQAGLKPPKVALPDKGKLEHMPAEFGSWRGEDVPLDPKTFEISGANMSVTRIYRDDSGNAISVLVAVFDDPDKGVYHSPINCYRSQGWDEESEDKLDVRVDERKKIPTDLTLWDQKGRRVAVLYWYQIGEHIIFDRFAVGGVRWAMRGQETWPATIKVLMEMPLSSDPEEDKSRLQNLAGHVYRWLNENPARPAADGSAS